MDSSTASTPMVAAMTNNSSAMAVVHRDNTAGLPTATVVEDDGDLSVARGLAKEAALLFQSGKYADCLRVLNQLLQKKPEDLKVLHNIALTESFRDACSDPKKLLHVLNNVKKRNEELARASTEHVEADSNTGSKTIVVNEGSTNASHHFPPRSSLPLVFTDDYDNSVAMFNMAVIWFHLHEHEKSFSILDVLFQKIEPIDEGIALRICLLLLDVALVSQHSSRCLDVINYIERVFSVNNMVNQIDNGNTALQQSTIVAKSDSLPSNLRVIDPSNSDSATTLESSLSRTLSDEALEDESMQLLSSLDINGEKLPRLSGLQSLNNLSKCQADDSISTVDLRLKLHLYKVHLLLLLRNLKAAKREIKMAMNMVRGNEHCYPMAFYLKSQLEYARGNHRKAIKLLMASSNRTEMGTSSIYYNNLGCIYFRLGKYHASNVLFSKALSNSSSLRKEKPLKLSTFSQDKSLLIVYNCGVQYMASGKPLLAARCFHKASQVFYHRPLLWLRVAECCLMALEKGLLKSSSPTLSDRSDVKVHVIGKGKWRDLAMEDGFSQNGLDNIGKEDLCMGDDRQPDLSIFLARRCLLNALYLLDRLDSRYSKSGFPCYSSPEEIESAETISSKNASYNNVSSGDNKTGNVGVGSGQVNSNGEVKEQKSGSSPNAYLLNSISDYEDIRSKENQIIRQALLADLAYVELELGNPLKALSMARSLLKLPDCSKIHVFLGNMYAAEALCMLNRPKEAVDHLFLYVHVGKSVELPYNQEDCEKWRVDKMVDCDEANFISGERNASLPDESQGFLFLKPEEACGTLYANLAAMSALHGDFEKANQFLIQALPLIPNSPEAILTAIYVDLMRGEVQEALGKLRRCNRIHFLPQNLKLSSSC